MLRMSPKKHELAILISLLLVGALLRFYALDQLPPGLYRDEAYNGLDALSVLEGERPIFFEANNGREPLFIYLVSISVGLLGRSALAIRLVSAVLGTLTIVAAFLLARALFSTRVGLLAAAITVGTFWAVNLSRIGFRTVALPLLLALTFWQLWIGIRSQKKMHFILAGLLWGLSFYTYLSARFTIFLLLVFGIYWLLTRQPGINIRQAAIFLLAAGVILFPLAAYFVNNWDLTLARSYQVSVLNPKINHGDLWGTLAGNTLGVLSMFNLRGDFIPRHNLPLRPVFDPILGLFFIVGVLLSFRRFGKSPEHTFLVIWTGSMLLPTLLAEGAPHFLRGVGILPAVLIFPALGLEEARRVLDSRKQGRVAIWGTALILGISTVWTARDYFLEHAPSEAVYYNFESGAAEMAAEINNFLADSNVQPQVYLAQRFWDNFPSLRFLVKTSPYLLLIPFESATETSAHERMLILWPFEDNRDTLQLLPRGSLISVREGAYERGDLEKEARLLYLSYSTIPVRLIPMEEPVRFGESILLLGSEVKVAEGKLRLHLFWQAIAAPQRDYIVFVHVLQDGETIAQVDGPPAQGYYPTGLWRRGDIVLDERRIELPEIAAGSGVQVRVGLYILETSERLPVFDAQGQPVGNSLILDVE